MARIQLRDTTIYLQDGLSGTAAVADVSPADLSGVVTLDIGTVVLNTDVTTQVPLGARFTVVGETATPVHTVTARTPTDGATTNIVFTPAMASDVSASAVINFLPQQVEIRIGDGDMSWTESREVLYDLDRDLLDDVRLGPEQPVELHSAFIFEWATSGSGEAISPVDAIKRIGGADEWVSSDSDQCRPYAIDVIVDHVVPCGTNQDQRFAFEDFRWESLEYSIQDASITLSGRCNRTDATVSRLTI